MCLVVMCDPFKERALSFGLKTFFLEEPEEQVGSLNERFALKVTPFPRFMMSLF